jgi:hypothetical protein
LGAKRRNPGALPAGGGFRLDLRHQSGDLFLPLLRPQVLPAGKRVELQGFAGRILEAAEDFPAAAREVLLGSRTTSPPKSSPPSTPGRRRSGRRAIPGDVRRALPYNRG